MAGRIILDGEIAFQPLVLYKAAFLLVKNQVADLHVGLGVEKERTVDPVNGAIELADGEFKYFMFVLLVYRDFEAVQRYFRQGSAVFFIFFLLNCQILLLKMQQVGITVTGRIGQYINRTLLYGDPVYTGMP